MTIDTAQFHHVFFEESFEGLEIMEASLLGLDTAGADRETIDTIFRAAHSIKGGSGTFGFTDITEFTHLLETLLDEMRAGAREITAEAVDLLLVSVDLLRDMLEAARSGTPLDDARAGELNARLEAMLAVPSAPAGPAEDARPAGEHDAGAHGWRIRFKPHEHMLRSGNDPLRLIRELGDLGALSVSADARALPPVSELDPESSYLGWELELHGDVPREAVSAIFDWVDGDCDLEIAALEAPGDRSAPGSAPPAGRPPAGGVDPSAPPRSAGAAEAASIRVGTDKIDALVNLVGELVITQAMLARVGGEDAPVDVDALQDGLAQLERNTRELQEGVMQIRMLPIRFAFSRFPRLVRDLSVRLGKQVELELRGEQTELDKTVLEKVGDPLVHLVRNALDHGIESPEVRVGNGKPAAGRITLEACHAGGSIVIEISDDGAGISAERVLARAVERGLVEPGDDLDEDEIFQLLFRPGFSTAAAVSDISGRGVGMDVVRRNITDLGGTVAVRSREGAGSTFVIRLPLTLAIIDGQLVEVGDQTYIVPLLSIVESLLVRSEHIGTIGGASEVYEFRDEHIPVVRLRELFAVDGDTRPATSKGAGLLVVVEGHGRRLGLHVDDLLGQQQIVIKSLEANFRPVEGLAGATILGDGAVALILDIPGLVALARRGAGAPTMAAVA